MTQTAESKKLENVLAVEAQAPLSQPMALALVPETTTTLVRVEAVPDDKLELLKRTVAKGTTDDEFDLFVQICNRTKLDPFARQIYAVMRKNKSTNKEEMNVQTSIDGFRLIAERSGKYAGQVGPFWCGNDGVWHDVWLSNDLPFAAKVGVLRKDWREPLYAVARFDNYAQYFSGKLGHMWDKMPDVMIAKCAEALALRKAFPQDLSGLYTSEEMSQADSDNRPASSFGAGATTTSSANPPPVAQQTSSAAAPERETLLAALKSRAWSNKLATNAECYATFSQALLGTELKDASVQTLQFGLNATEKALASGVLRSWIEKAWKVSSAKQSQAIGLGMALIAMRGPEKLTEIAGAAPYDKSADGVKTLCENMESWLVPDAEQVA